jgi:hypothetical protein
MVDYIHDFMSANLISRRPYASHMRRLHKWRKTAQKAQFSGAQFNDTCYKISKYSVCIYSDASPDYSCCKRDLFPTSSCMFLHFTLVTHLYPRFFSRTWTTLWILNRPCDYWSSVGESVSRSFVSLLRPTLSRYSNVQRILRSKVLRAANTNAILRVSKPMKSLAQL